MEQLTNLLLNSFTGQLTLAIMATIFVMMGYFVALFMKKPDDHAHK